MNYTNDDFLNVLIVEARCRKEFIHGIFVKANGIPHNYVRCLQLFTDNQQHLKIHWKIRAHCLKIDFVFGLEIHVLEKQVIKPEDYVTRQGERVLCAGLGLF